MNAEVIAIGTEILLGEITDTNTRVIARALRNLGLDLHRTTTVGDNVERIAAAVRESLTRSKVVITTGGLGPTVDDPTREAVALALGVDLEFRGELWDQIQDRFARFGRTPTENNRRQAYVPAGATAVENPVGTAPAFIAEIADSSIVALPGVPEEMEALLDQAVIPYLRRRFDLHETILTRVLRTAGVGESALDEKIGDLERLSNPTVGLSAHPGRVDIRLTAKAASAEAARALIRPLEETIRERLRDAIYGVDDENLEQVTANALRQRGWRLTTVEHSTGGALSASLASAGEKYVGGEVLPLGVTIEELRAELERARHARLVEAGLAVSLLQNGSQQRLSILLITPEGEHHLQPTYGGAPHSAARWAVSLALDLLRLRLGPPQLPSADADPSHAGRSRR
jgi:competence/damage-inducible protein CinA-like protein